MAACSSSPTTGSEWRRSSSTKARSGAGSACTSYLRIVLHHLRASARRPGGECALGLSQMGSRHCLTGRCRASNTYAFVEDYTEDLRGIALTEPRRPGRNAAAMPPAVRVRSRMRAFLPPSRRRLAESRSRPQRTRACGFADEPPPPLPLALLCRAATVVYSRVSS
jgi:hypothetical protein